MVTLSDERRENEYGHGFYFEEHIQDLINIIRTKIIAKQGVSDYILNGNINVDIINEAAGKKFIDEKKDDGGSK